MIRLYILVFLLLLSPPGLQAKSEEPPLTLLPPQGQQQNAAQQQSLSNNNMELHDIYGPIPLAEPVSYLLIAGLLAVLVLLFMFLIWFFKYRKRPTPPPVPPWEKARQELLAAKQFLNPKESIIYLEKVSVILRRYIESRFEIKSTKQTTREFLTSLEFCTENEVLQAHKDKLHNCLQKADMAKFARHSVKQSELEVIQGSLIDFVDTTTPVNQSNGGKP